VDLRAFADRALRRMAALPDAWQRELRELAARVCDEVPSMRDLFETTWRVFAVFLLALLLANLLFPDNVYAKSSGHSSSSSGSSMQFSDSQSQTSPFRFRQDQGGRGAYRVTDQFGRMFEAPPFVFSEQGGGRLPLLALTRELRLVDGGGVAYHARVAGHQFLVRPDRLDVITNRGDRLMSLHPGPLVDQATAALAAQGPLVGRAMDDHRRWMAWTRWSSMLDGGREVQSEMDELERLQRAMATTQAQWSAILRAPQIAPRADWRPLMPGVFLAESGGSKLVLLGHDGVAYSRPTDPPATVTDVDRFVFGVLQWATLEANDSSLAPTVERWRAMHGSALNPPPGGPR
jgi:hypothetical protein